MLDGRRVSDELFEMASEPPDTILHRAVQRIHQAGGAYDWVGIYLLAHGQLILHSYIGKQTDLTRIAVGSGVCGTAVAEDRDMNVLDVAKLDKYMACSAGTRSEIVLLFRHGDRVVGLLDIDSDREAAFGPADERELRVIADALGELVGSRLRYSR
jgi:GAF domain-containing protein